MKATGPYDVIAFDTSRGQLATNWADTLKDAKRLARELWADREYQAAGMACVEVRDALGVNVFDLGGWYR